MKQTIKIQTVSQWYLLKQINDNGFFRKKKIPEEVMKQIFHVLYTKELGRDGFLVLCFDKVYDDYIGMDDLAGIYPYRLCLDDEIDKIKTRNEYGKVENWYITHAKVRGQRTKIQIVYTTKDER